MTHTHRPLLHWTLGLPFECDEFNDITTEYLESIVTYQTYNYTFAGIDPVTSMKGWVYNGIINPGNNLEFIICLKNVTTMDRGEYAVGGTLNDGTFAFANNGRVQVPDICACNITIPTGNPTQMPTGILIFSFFF